MVYKKFGRNYELYVDGNDGEALIIRPPFTLKFNIVRNTLADANTSSFEIYNLSLKNRNNIRKDQDDYDNFKRIILKAGYGENLSQVFYGNISKAWSVREGTNFMTHIHNYDGGFGLVNSTIDQAFPKDSLQRSIIKTAMKTMKPNGVQTGAIGGFIGAITRGNSVSGNSAEIIKEMTGGNFFIDNGYANSLKNDEVLDNEIFVINPSSGLLATPTREFKYVNLELLFEPKIVVGQRVKIDSFTDKSFNAIYKVHSIQHSGIISESVGGNARTTLGLQPGEFNVITRERE